MDSSASALPVAAHRQAILDALGKGPLILGAPPGTGKSTQVPRFLLEVPGRILVLQPRRIAARNLALRVAEELGEPVGMTAGFQVRFEGKSGESTRILFQTYGVFFQQLLSDPFLRGVGSVVLDEFHERTLESDATLGWLKALRGTARPDLRLVVMSATLDTEALERYLSAEPAAPPGASAVAPDRSGPAVPAGPSSQGGAVQVLRIPGKAYPVEVLYQAPSTHEPLGNQALRALKRLLGQGLSGSVLVFMPGQGEIRRVMETLDPLCRQEGLGLFELHGSMDAEAQQRAIRAPSRGPCVIVSTNVAETSLTIPGITAVIDSGQARIASFSAQRDMNTLYLGSISLANAIQRSGRAGRTAPGVCIRLWSQDRERGMAPALDPEALRVEPTSMLLSLHALRARAASLGEAAGMRRDGPAGYMAAYPGYPGYPGYPAGYPGYRGRYLVDWLTEPSQALWEKAEQSLRRIGAVSAATEGGTAPKVGAAQAAAPGTDPGVLTALGRDLSRFPAHPVLARVLLDAERAGAGTVAAAMVAILESQSRRTKGSSPDLFALGADLAADPEARQWDRDTREGFKQLLRLLSRGGRGARDPEARRDASPGVPESAAREAATAPWIVPFQDRIAVRVEKGQSFQLADGRKGVAEAGQVPPETRVILALELHETGGSNQARQVGIPMLLPCESAWVERAFPGECRWTKVGGWDEARGKVVQEEQLLFRGLALERRALKDGVLDPAESSRLLVEKLVAGEIVLPGFDDDARQLVNRIRLTAKTYPEYGIPALDEDDWRLIYDSICEGKSSERDLEAVSVAGALREYLGHALMAFVDRSAPTTMKLPGVRQGRLTYFENAAPELSARLGDFIGMQGRLTLMDGKVEVVYDILAPNYRTVQKTSDLTGFWKNTYPEVKKELKRRYPKHPWPDL